MYLRILGKDLQLETSALLVFFSVVSKIFEKLVNNRIVDPLDRILSKHFCLQPSFPKDSVSLLFSDFSCSVG